MKPSNLAVTVLALLPTSTSSAQGPCAEEALIQILGAGTHGTLGIPSLGFDGAPLVGGPFRFRVTSARAEAPGFFGYSPTETPLGLPAHGATLYPSLPLFVVPFQVDRSGSSPALMPTAAVPPRLCGHVFVAQAAVLDPVAQGGLAFTRAYRLRFGLPVDGPLFPAAKYPVGEESWDVASGDLDGDGVIDLAVANKGSDDVSVFRGLGSGTFGSAQAFAVGEYPDSVASADLDADGDLDLAVTCGGQYLLPASTPGSVDVLPGVGDGSFGPAQSYFAGEHPRSVAIADLDADGALDLAVGCAGSYTIPGSVGVLLGVGDGTFAAVQSMETLGKTGLIAIGDVNGDLLLDLAASQPSLRAASVFLGRGDGTFEPALSFLAGREYPIAIADVDGRGLDDLVVGKWVLANLRVH